MLHLHIGAFQPGDRDDRGCGGAGLRERLRQGGSWVRGGQNYDYLMT